MITCAECRCNRLAIIFVIAFTLIAAFSICYADEVTIPNNFYIGNRFPFGDIGNIIYQQVYSASLFPGILRIDALHFYIDTSGGPNSGFVSGNYQISLSTTTKPVGGLDSSDLAGNVGSDNQIFFDGLLSGGSSISGSPFIYDAGKGNLLLMVVTSNKVASGSASEGNFWRGAANTGASRAYYLQDLGQQGSDNLALVTTFTFEPVQPVFIEIKPTTINLKKTSQVSVTIFSMEGFDPVNQIVRESLTFGLTGLENSINSCATKFKDLNRDGVKDLICYFDILDGGFPCGENVGILNGVTDEGVTIIGSDSVTLIHCP